MNAEDPRLTAFALDALAASERIQVQHALSDNPSLVCELESIEEFSSRLGRAFQKTSQHSLGDAQWAEITSAATPSLEPVALPVTPRSNLGKSVSPWILPLAATVVAAAIVCSTMFYKPGSPQPVEAKMLSQTNYEKAQIVTPDSNRPIITPRVAVRETRSASLPPPPVATRDSQPVLQKHQPASAATATAVGAVTGPLQMDKRQTIDFEDFLSHGAPTVALETIAEPEDAGIAAEEASQSQPPSFSAPLLGGGAAPIAPAVASDPKLPVAVAEQPSLRQTLPFPEKKITIASKTLPTQPRETEGKVPAPRQNRTPSATTPPANNPPAQLAQNPSEPVQSATFSEPPFPLAAYEGGTFGQLPPELIPESYTIVDENLAVVTVTDSSGALAIAGNGVSGTYEFGSDEVTNNSSGTDTLFLYNVSLYSANGITSNLMAGDMDGLVILSISKPYAVIQEALPSNNRIQVPSGGASVISGH